MSFWLDAPGLRTPYRRVLSSDPLEPVPEPKRIAEPIVTPLVPAPLGSSARRRRRRDFCVSMLAALAVHAALVALLCSSTSKARPNLPPSTDSGAMFASLTPASSITPEPSSQPPLPDVATHEPGVVKAPSQVAAVSPDTPAQPDIPYPMQSAKIDQATINTSAVSTNIPTPFNGALQNPWTHASVATPDATLNERLWAAIKPCWRNGGAGASSLRLVLDEGGRVQSMTDLEGGDALANPKAHTLARAIQACAPYDRLVSNAGAYLIVAPS